jgi:hypothetical protein
MVIIEFKRTTLLFTINSKFSNNNFYIIEPFWIGQLLPKNDIIRITQIQYLKISTISQIKYFGANPKLT